jgi:RNA polymerase sigma factor (sigma-70 family)
MSAGGVRFDDYFEDLYGRYAERLMRVVVRRLWRGESSAESVVQTVLLSYAERLRAADPERLEQDELWRLLFRGALRHCNKHNHRTSRGREVGKFPVPFSVVEQQAGPGNPDPPAPDAGLEELDRGGWIEHVLHRLGQQGLDEREQGVFRLKLAGYSREEIAAQTGFTQGRVNTLLRRVRAVVAGCVEEDRE